MASGFFAQAMADAGSAIRGIQAQQNFDQNQQLTQQQIDTNKMAMMAQQKHQKAEADVSAYMGAKLENDQSIVGNPMKMAELQRAAATEAYKAGDYMLGKQMATEAAESVKEAKAAMAEQVAEKAQAQQDLATSAYEFTSGDMNSPEAQKELVDKAIAARIPLTSIPKPEDKVAFQAWAQKMDGVARTSQQRAEFVEKAKTAEDKASDRKQDIAEREKKENDDKANKAEERRQEWAKIDIERAKAARENRDKGAKLPAKEIEGDYEYIPDPEHKYQGKRRSDIPGTVGYDYVQSGVRKLYSQESGGISRALPSAAEIIRQSKLAAGLNANLDPFGHIDPDTMVSAVEKIGTNKYNSDETLAYTKSIKGMGVEAAGLLGSMGGRTPPLSVMNELQDMASRSAGMSKIVGAYGAALMTDLTRTYVSHLPLARTHTNPDIEDTLKELDQFPRAEQIAALIRKQGTKEQKKQMEKLEGLAQSDKKAGVAHLEIQGAAAKSNSSEASAPPPGFTMN